MTTPEPEAPSRRPMALIFILVTGALIGAFVFWRHHYNPTKKWADRVEHNHADQINRALTRCFGGSDEATIRRVIAQTRTGTLPTPFRDCRSGPAAELIVAPNGFMENLRDAPEQVTGLSARARGDLLRLSTSARQLELALSAGGASPNEAQRDAIVHSLDDVAHDVGAEQQSIHDLVSAAHDAAGWL